MIQKFLKWVYLKNPLYFLKIQQLIAIAYALCEAILNSIGVLTFHSSSLSLTLLSSLITILVTVTQKGMIYFSRLYRISVGILMLPPVVRQLWRWNIISEKVEIKVVLALSICAFVFFVAGLLIGNKTKRK